MYAAQDCRLKAEHYAELAQGAKTLADRDRFLRQSRSYALIARSAHFDKVLDDLITRLKR